MEEGEERWPIAKDIALAIGIGFLIAVKYVSPIRPFWATWLACSAAAFFVIATYHMFGPAESALRAFGWFVVAGAIGGAVWWLVTDSGVSVWMCVAVGVGLVILGSALSYVLGDFRKKDEDAA